jgi:hypothetical protein
MVLTDADYAEFNEKNPYLAAKLITIFVEHPIVFIGYSISDPNISTLLRSISLCIGADNVEQLRRNLIFVQTPKEGETEGISDTYLTIDGVQIPLVLVRTNDFMPLYEAMQSAKRKIPARVLRYCKEQLYELVRSSEPEKKLCVINIDEMGPSSEIEFVVGVGVASAKDAIAEVGYAPIEAMDLFADLLHEDRQYEPKQVLEHTIPNVGRNSPNVPVFKYLAAHGIKNREQYEKSDLKLDKWVKRDLKEFRVKMYSRPFARTYRSKTIQEIIDGCTPENASAYIPFLSREKIDLDVLRDFLIKHEGKMRYENSNYASNFRKLASLYDKYKWGW